MQTGDDDDIFMVSRQGMTIRFSENDVRAMGRDAAGVRGMALRAGDEVVSIDPARDDVSILMVTDAGYGKRTQLHHFNRQGRGGMGVRGIRLTAQRGRVVAAFMVGLDDEILVISSAGVMVRMPVREISSQGRDATGVRVVSLDAGQVVASVAPVLAEESRLMARRAADRSAEPAEPTASSSDGGGPEEDSVPTDPGRSPARRRPRPPGRPVRPGPPAAGPPPGPADTDPQFAAGYPAPGDPGWVPPPPVGPSNGPVDRAVPVPPRRQPRGPRVVQGRRTRQVIRRIDSWTVFKLSLLFYLCGGLILLVAGIALWNIAGAFDVITNVEKFIQKLFDLQTFKTPGRRDPGLVHGRRGRAGAARHRCQRADGPALQPDQRRDRRDSGHRARGNRRLEPRRAPAGEEDGRVDGSDDGLAGRRDRSPVDDPSVSP